MNHSQIENLLNISVANVIEKIPYTTFDTAWVSGSLIEGIGNKSSDIDIYVAIDSSLVKDKRMHKESEFYEEVYFSNSKRVDYEYWDSIEISKLAERLNQAPIFDDKKSILGYFSELEVEFIHRILVGVPLVNEHNFTNLQNMFNKNYLRVYLVKEKCINVDDAFDDTVGILDGGDIVSAAYRARFTVESSIDMLLYSYGITNGKEKHRYRFIKQVANRYPETVPLIQNFWLLSKHIPDREDKLLQYIHKCLSLSEDIVHEVESKQVSSYENAL